MMAEMARATSEVVRDFKYDLDRKVAEHDVRINNLASQITGLKSATFLKDLMWETFKSFVKYTLGITLTSKPQLN